MSKIDRMWGEWMDWSGTTDTPPIQDGTEFQVRMRSGRIMGDNEASMWTWDHCPEVDHIVAYRVAQSARFATFVDRLKQFGDKR